MTTTTTDEALKVLVEGLEAGLVAVSGEGVSAALADSLQKQGLQVIRVFPSKILRDLKEAGL